MRTHEAGPTWLREPDDVNALYPGLWAAGVERDGDGVLRVGGLSVKELATEFGTPLFVVDENDFRSRARTFREAFGAVLGGADVYYAGKAFLSVAVARWIADEGLSLDVCSGG